MLRSDNPSFPGMTPYPFDKDNPNFESYIQRNTYEAYPLHRQAFLNYLKAMLTVSDPAYYDPDNTDPPPKDSIPYALDQFDRYYDPFRYNLLHVLLNKPILSNYNDIDVSWVVTFSRVVKNPLLLELVCRLFFEFIDFELIYSNGWLPDSITSLDPANSSILDSGSFTDYITEGAPRYLGIFRYPYLASSGASYQDFLQRIHKVKDLMSIVLPARLFFGIYLCPEFFHDPASSADLTTFLDPRSEAHLDTDGRTDDVLAGDLFGYGYDVVTSPFQDNASLAIIKQFSDDEISGIYNTVFSVSGFGYSILENTGRKKSFLIYRNSFIDSLTISSGSSEYPELAPLQVHFPVSSLADANALYPQIMDLPVQYIRFTIRFP